MPTRDPERWDEVADHVYVRRVGGEVKGPDATEAALALAASYGLDITEVVGTGSGGRITKWDVENYLAEDDYPEDD
jgi:pyruvate/2-oxoglutarate dehydrogenase complex dihydrolipoamide acyltransferase (E2) component